MIAENCIIDIRGLHTRYGTHVIHEHIDLCVHQGEVLTLVGGSGSGKTTLLRHILGLEVPGKGTIRLFGHVLEECSRNQQHALRNRMGVLFQQGALFSALSVFDNIALPMRELHTMSQDMIHNLVMRKLEMVGIEPEHAYKMPADLSGGMVKRIALARALALNTELLFLDEPTAGLDPERSKNFISLIKALRSDLKLTVVMVTHDLETLMALSDRLAVLADRHLIALGTITEVSSLDHPFINSFFPDSHNRQGMMEPASGDRE